MKTIDLRKYYGKINDEVLKCIQQEKDKAEGMKEDSLVFSIISNLEYLYLEKALLDRYTAAKGTGRSPVESAIFEEETSILEKFCYDIEDLRLMAARDGIVRSKPGKLDDDSLEDPVYYTVEDKTTGVTKTLLSHPEEFNCRFLEEPIEDSLKYLEVLKNHEQAQKLINFDTIVAREVGRKKFYNKGDYKVFESYMNSERSLRDLVFSAIKEPLTSIAAVERSSVAAAKFASK